MPDLIACPTCGLPAEIVESAGDKATARCVVMHDFDVTVERLDVRPPPTAAAVDTKPDPAARVVPFPAPQVRARPEWARRMAWFTFGALAAFLLLRAPVAAVLLLPLSLPFIGVEAARKSWRPLSRPGQAVELPWTKRAENEGREAA